MREVVKVRITRAVCGWPVGSIAYCDPGPDWDGGVKSIRAYNNPELLGDSFAHTIGTNCEVVQDEPEPEVVDLNEGELELFVKLCNELSDWLDFADAVQAAYTLSKMPKRQALSLLDAVKRL